MRAGFFPSLAVAVVALAAPTAQAAERAVVVGGYRPVEVTPELRALLFDALHNETTYADDVGARVCVADVVSVAQQVVAGMNYRFTTSACDIRKTLLLQSDQSPKDSQVAALLGECKPEFARKCVEVDAVVTVYRALDDTKSVSRIEATDKPVGKPTEKPAAEEPAAHVVVRVHAAKEF